MNVRRALIGLSLCLVSCTGGQKAVVPQLEPDEVLRRAATAAQKLESAQYTAQGEFDTQADNQSVSGTMRIDGALQEAGKQLKFQIDIDADLKGAETNAAVSGTVEVVMLSGEEVYLNVHSVTSKPASAIFSSDMIDAIAGHWWKLPGGAEVPVASVTPDPRLLHAQSQVVEVVKDRGIDTMNGVPNYHFDVRLNKEKLVAYLAEVAQKKGTDFASEEMRAQLEQLSAVGELWIDAEQFNLQKVIWKLSSLPLEHGGTASATLTITFRNHNKAPAIVPPEASDVFSPAALFSFPTDSL